MSADQLESARALFAGAGLPFPFIPASLHGDFHLISKAVYGTRAEMPASIEDLSTFVKEAEGQPVADYALVGHGGHGVSSYAIHYYLVYNGLGLFLQVPWGGAYTDKKEAAAAVAHCFGEAEKVIHAVEERPWTGSRRLLLVESGFYGARWQEGDGAWREGRPVFPPVMSALESRLRAP